MSNNTELFTAKCGSHIERVNMYMHDDNMFGHAAAVDMSHRQLGGNA